MDLTATETVARAYRRGVELLVDGERLGYQAPVGIVDQPLRASLAAHKSQVLTIVMSGVLPCPHCEQPLDGFQCCWECPGRICQACGAWMAQRPYSRECAACQTERFAQLAAART